MTGFTSITSRFSVRSSARRVARIGAVLGLALATMGTAFAGPRFGSPAGLYPSRSPAGLYSSGQGALYNGGRPGPTVCGLSRCMYGGSPAGLFNSRYPW
jgi:hypothetical protein